MFEITFGMALDGARWVDVPASIGRMKCGPLGMLKFLETRYALGGVAASDFERVDAYIRKIQAADCEWCRKSFAIDPWSTASALLAWRDELVTLKWDRRSCGDSVRVAALAQIEAAGPELPLGMADRLVRLPREATRKLAAELTLVDDFEDLPLVWREILSACFEGWTAAPRPERAMPEVTVVKGVNEISLARDVARYLSVGGAESVAVISEFDTQVLDAEMKRLGLPTFGESDSSRERRPIQAMIAALSEYGRTRSGEEYPVRDVIAALDEVSRKLRGDVDPNSLSRLAISHISALKARLEGMTSIRRSALWRMAQTIVGEGARCPDSRHEQMGVRFLRSPAELTEEVDVALWWMFAPAIRHSGLLFREEEKKLFGASAAGKCVVDDERERRNRREAKSWERCLSEVKQRLVLFVPDVMAGDTTGIQPFYDLLLKKLGKESNDIEVRNGGLVKDGAWRLAGRTVKLVRKDAFRPKFSDVCSIKPDAALCPKEFSPTQLESLLACPFQWYHKYFLGLAPCEPAKSDTIKTRQGNMAHKMVEELVGAGALGVEEMKAEFQALFDKYCDEEIPEYAEPDRQIERDDYRERLLSSLTTLWNLMADKGLVPIESEFEFEKKDFCGVPFSGRTDLILEDRGGRRHIFDFKWSTRKDFADKVKEGTSVQLAAYDWLDGFDSESGYYLFPKETFIENTQDNRKVWDNVVATYQKRMETLRSGDVPKAIDIGLDGKDQEQRRLKVEAQGLSIDVHAGCRYCDFKALCGKLWEENGGAE